MNHPIPLMTHPLGRGWDQPPRERVLVDDDFALMSKADANLLPTYDHSLPSGVYPGKMWLRTWGHDEKIVSLCWYGEVCREFCPVETRNLLTIE